MIEEVRIPEISENVTSGKVVKVLVQVGETVEIDDILIEFETEKALVEIPSTAYGKIVEIPISEGQELKVGDLIAKIETSDQNETSKTADEPAEAKVHKKTKASSERVSDDSDEEKATTRKSSRDIDQSTRKDDGPGQSEPETKRPPAPAAPSVRRFARELGVDIYQVQGHGPGGRISEDDVKAFVKQGGAAAPSGPTIPAHEPSLPDFSRWGEIEPVELPAVRRLTAQSTATSWQMVPHVTQFDRSDITLLESFLKNKGAKLQRRGIKLTVTAVVAKVCAAALLKFPRFNASIDMGGNRLIFKKYVHIGVAVDTERGLLVPVIRNADGKSISELAADISDLAERARNKKIKPDEMEGGSFTISNQGGIGGTQFTPIVMWPQAAILGISRTAVEPLYLDGAFQPRSMLPLALSYDHRIIDGADAARFLRWICECLEQPFNLHLD